MKKAKNMSPLLLVGILFSAAVADVSHVLSGSAHPPADANEVNQLAYAKTAFQTGNPQDFWWMASNSPLKQAYDYFKKCSSKGDCLPPANAVGEASGDAKGAAAGADFGPIDLKSNPFLNGAYQSGGVSSSAAFAPSSSSGAGSSSSSGGCSVCASGGGAQAGGVAAFHSGTKIDIAGNPFLNGQFAFASNGEKVKDENGFLGVQPKKPGFATSHPLSNKKPFATSPPVGQQSFVLGGGEIEGIACQGHGAICVAKEQCVNGVVDKKDVFQVKNDVQHCDAETEVCCRLASASGGSSSKAGFTGLVGKGNLPANINDLVEVSAGKSSVTGSPLKFSGGVGTSPGQIQVLTDQSPDGKLCHGGESGNTNKPVRDISVSGSSGNLFPTADYSNVQFDSNVRFASSIQGPAYLPPIELSPSTPTTSPSLCPAGTFLAPSGRCEGRKVETCPPGTTKIPDGTCEPRAPTCPPGTALTPFGSCEVPKKPAPVCPSGTVKLPDGSCATPTPKQCPPGTFLTASGSCQPPATPISCPFGTKQRPDGTCESPTSPIPCPAGTILGASGSCEPTTVQRCPFGTIQTPDGSCESPPTTPRPCPPGTTRTVSGSCEAIKTPSCPFGTILRPDGSCGSINPPTTPKPCPPGTILTASGLCEAVVSPTPGCPFGTIQRPDGSCETRSTPAPPRPCPPGTIRTGSGLCEAVVSPTPGCPFGTIQKPDGSCETRSTPAPPRPCPPGTIRTGSGLCEAVVSPTPGCPFGTIQRPDGSCETRTTPAPPRPCPPGTIRTGSGLCEAIVSPTPGCPFGTIQRPDGSCETRSTPAPPRPCPPGTIRTGSGLCEALRTISCPFGTVQRPDGSCEARTPPPVIQKCPPGTVLTASGLCEATRISISCPFGTIQRPDGTCEQPPIVSSTPRPCPTGTFLTSSGLCESPVTPSPTTPGYTYPKPCPPGTFKTPAGLCETPIVTTPRPQCPFGTYLTPSGSCETPRPTSPKPPPSTTASREYLPPVTPTQPPVTYVYNTPTPTFSYPSRSPTPSVVPGSTIPPGSSIPEEPDKVDQGTNIESIKIATNPPPTSPPNRPNINVEQNNSPPVGCAAALKCVQEIYCTAEGFVSPVPVVLTKEQELLRAPTTECKDLETGIIGKCCRDLNYKDPWPSANLVNGVDNGQYKEDNFYGQSELLGSNRLTRSFNATGGDRPRVRTSVVSINAEDDHTNCGERHHDTKPLGEGPIDAKFAEYPWQAMILRDSNRSLLCGGAIIRKNAVLTTAHCVEGLETSDVLIKGGEWKLGIDEEPLPFQIVKVAAILRHPGYKPGSYENDLAVLVLHEKLRMTKNVGTICLPQPNQAPAPASKCVVTGWGKRILQLHAKGAIMHHIDVALMDGQECQQTLTQKSQNALQLYNPTTLCGVSNADHCKVDYGSALACSDDQQHYTLHGIYTWDTGCGQDGQVGGYITPDIEWIDSIMARPLKQLKRIEKEYLLNKG